MNLYTQGFYFLYYIEIVKFEFKPEKKNSEETLNAPHIYMSTRLFVFIRWHYAYLSKKP